MWVNIVYVDGSLYPPWNSINYIFHNCLEGGGGPQKSKSHPLIYSDALLDDYSTVLPAFLLQWDVVEAHLDVQRREDRAVANFIDHILAGGKGVHRWVGPVVDIRHVCTCSEVLT